jgi:hypothetical protein
LLFREGSFDAETVAAGFELALHGIATASAES